MMTGRVVLDSFDAMTVAGLDLDQGLIPRDEADGGLPSPDGAMDAAGIKPPRKEDESAVDGQSEEAQRTAEIAALSENLSMVLQTVTRDAAQATKDHLSAVNAVIAEAAQGLLPNLAEKVGSEEIGATIVDVARAMQDVAINVTLHPDVHDRIVSCLEPLNFPEPITVTSDTSIAPGQARLQWSHGGCDININAALETAQKRLNTRLDALVAAPTTQQEIDGESDE